MFSEVRRDEPYHIEGMEIYSTALWHLQKEVELSALAQELTEMDKDSPEVRKLYCCVDHTILCKMENVVV